MKEIPCANIDRCRYRIGSAGQRRSLRSHPQADGPVSINRVNAPTVGTFTAKFLQRTVSAQAKTVTKQRFIPLLGYPEPCSP